MTGFSNRLDSGDGREKGKFQRINRLFLKYKPIMASSLLVKAPIMP